MQVFGVSGCVQVWHLKKTDWYYTSTNEVTSITNCTTDAKEDLCSKWCWYVRLYSEIQPYKVVNEILLTWASQELRSISQTHNFGLCLDMFSKKYYLNDHSILQQCQMLLIMHVNNAWLIMHDDNNNSTKTFTNNSQSVGPQWKLYSIESNPNGGKTSAPVANCRMWDVPSHLPSEWCDQPLCNSWYSFNWYSYNLDKLTNGKLTNGLASKLIISVKPNFCVGLLTHENSEN